MTSADAVTVTENAIWGFGTTADFITWHAEKLCSSQFVSFYRQKP